MQTRTLAVLTLVGGLCFAGAALAETIVVDDQVQVRDSTVDKPKRGVTMSQVEAKFGAPVTKHDAVGQPPITRWDYAGFSVFFEHDRVIDSVVTSG
jgi:outer membrane protein assembly factor BamE (lipoprotein component of BamABCDE complex)